MLLVDGHLAEWWKIIPKACFQKIQNINKKWLKNLNEGTWKLHIVCLLTGNHRPKVKEDIIALKCFLFSLLLGL